MYKRAIFHSDVKIPDDNRINMYQYLDPGPYVGGVMIPS